MKSSMGKALKTKVVCDVDGKRARPSRGTGSYIFSVTRQRILGYLCRHPCLHLRAIAERLEVSPAAAKWHLRKLSAGDYIAQARVGSKVVFYPKGMVDDKDLPVLVAMNENLGREVYALISDRPGIRRKEISKALAAGYNQVLSRLKTLGDLGLVSSVQDGRHIRHFPTDRLRDMQAEHRERLVHYGRLLAKKLKEDGLSPKTVRSVHGDTVIVLQSGDETVEITLFPGHIEG